MIDNRFLKSHQLLTQPAWVTGATTAALLTVAATFTEAAQAFSPFNIELNFITDVSAANQAAFETAEATWESLIVGYQPSVTSVFDLVIDVEFTEFDGPGGALAGAGPNAGITEGGFGLPALSFMFFDTADIDQQKAEGIFESTILHEMAHAMGFGTLWNNEFFDVPQQVYVEGSGQYTGAFGLAAYQREYDPTASFVPVELDGGPGTANSHWDELFVTDPFGRPLFREIMTGLADPPEEYISNTTIQSFADIGYLPARFTADPNPLPNLTPDSASVPEPASTAALVVIGFSGWMLNRSRRKTIGRVC